MAKDLLLEIGTEEIPARFMPEILAQLSRAARAKFDELRIDCESIRTVGTPRRMALLVRGMAEKQADRSAENKGPSVNVAFDADGNPTKAGAGFARGQKVDPKDLVVKDGYVYAMVREAGKDTESLLGGVLPELILGLNFPKNMRWADLDLKFVRPIKWIVALFGEAVVPFAIANVRSGNLSRGHRFLGGDALIPCAAEYERVLKEQFVIVDQDARRAMILDQIEALAAKQGGRAEITEDLLEEVVYLVEYPTALCGGFEEKYLALPKEAVITPMREHQRYFPVISADGKLMPLFITVRNGGKAHLETVQRGNERVLRARLADARFFFEEDCKVKLVDRLEKLKSVVFQEGLGTVYDKTVRLEKLALFLAKAVGADDAVISAAKRAALLSKADLVTGMVCEFTELQGVMGREYALIGGEREDVAAAIYEHYLPRFAGDALPDSMAGRLISIADKMDNIVATFSRGLIPTGSQDPFALRRQALGIVNILIAAKCHISLEAFVGEAMSLLRIDEAEKRARLIDDVREFFCLRVKNVLTDAGIRYDVIDAVIGAGLDDVYGAYLRAKAVAGEIDRPDMAKAVQAFVRVGNLAKKAERTAIDENLLQSKAEENLFKAYASAASAVDSLITGEDFAGAIDAMMDLTEPIDAFFDAVMVMDKDEAIRENRLALLKAIVDMSLRLADFSKLVL